MDDAYQASGEFIDVLSGPAWLALRVPVRAALHGAAASQGPLVDVGAGTGLGTRELVDACPTATVLAVEPSPVLRAVLLSRVASDPRLRERVTVMAADALGAELPDRLGAVVAVNMIGHLTPDDRRTFWRRVGERLAAGAPLVVNLQPPAESATIPYTTFGAVQVGRYTYEGGGGAEPAGPDTVTWRMRYRILDADGAAVRESTVDYRWHVLSAPDLLDELADAGMRGQIGSLGVVRAVRAG
jgi:trans-aconitate methyltransferase